jgi:hypothetical protein
MKFWFVVFCFVVTGLAHRPAHAVVELPQDHSAPLNLAPHLEVLEDTSRELTISDVQKHTKFVKNGDTHPVPGYTTSAWWVRFALKNSTSHALKRYIEYADSGEGIPSITFFVPRENAGYEALEAGGRLKQSERLHNHRHNIAPITIPPHSTTTFYVRALGDSVKIPLYLHSQDSLFHFNYKELSWIGFVYGFLLILASSNFAIFLASRDPSYLYYVGFVAGLALSLGGFDGITGQYLFSNSRYFFMRSVNISSSFSIGFLLLFTTSFLQLKAHTPKMARIAITAAIFAFSVSLLNTVWKQNMLVNLTVTCCSLLCIAAAAWAAFRRVPLAPIFLIPISVFLGAVITTTFKQVGLLPSVFLTEEALRLGALTSALLWALALAYRVRHTLQQQHTVQMQALELEIVAKKNNVEGFQKLSQIVTDISDKLNSPLLVIIHVFERIRERAQPLAKLDSSSLPNNLLQFMNSWHHHSPKVFEAIQSLKVLSQELSERREEPASRIPTEETISQ